ncbi:hypothetical protein N7532_010179 [Penicillium argentinense]|uniref:Uncharacterized protein n=1 Tax=Penicillium argentinense TaxID=1131581 RepID=A0A9W9JXP2_9EURO|nr:uncharacterized protein N7532_010179 [Penicillium argentinense]KAJ5085408.1 hypothetical protein N7532_010179 [Penicillium argentinense]
MDPTRTKLSRNYVCRIPLQAFSASPPPFQRDDKTHYIGCHGLGPLCLLILYQVPKRTQNSPFTSPLHLIIKPTNWPHSKCDPSSSSCYQQSFLWRQGTSADCPANWLENSFHVTRCCYGNMVVAEKGAYCCVYDLRPPTETTTANTATTTSETDWSTVNESCVAKVPFTASDYSSQVSSASSKAVASTNASSGKVTSTDTAAAATRTGSGFSSFVGSQTPSTTSNGAIPIATAQEFVAGGAAIAAALFVL